ncbi:uncharacterized protein [Diabrotica undecimpunctata]|uniref:uncharacterized protein n=1 Tax=Diabrotica undecimpunctata TaxID=50387 RepID=UPI003B6358F6
MNIGTWNIQGIKQKIDISVPDLEQMKMDNIALTETKKKGTGTDMVGNYIHIFTGVPKDKRAARGVSILIKKKLKNNITHWETIDKNILRANIDIYGHKITMIAAYAPSDDDEST